MKTYNNITELVGNTPLLRVQNIENNHETKANIYAKLEYFNPSSSIKDRAALYMIKDFEAKGLLKKGCTIVEPTSGNTGIGLCMIAADRGYNCIIVMPDTMSIERQKLMTAYGAKLVLTEGKLGMSGAIAKAQELVKENETYVMPSQFDNMENVNAHKETTALELYNDMDGKIDILIAGVGTGGTLTGTALKLKELIPSIKVVAVEPAKSSMISKGVKGPHGIQGIGAGFIPSILNVSIIDEVVTVLEQDAYNVAREMARSQGALVGISSGASMHAGIELAKRSENQGKNIVVICPDSGERYLSTALFSE